MSLDEIEIFFIYDKIKLRGIDNNYSNLNILTNEQKTLTVLHSTVFFLQIGTIKLHYDLLVWFWLEQFFYCSR